MKRLSDATETLISMVVGLLINYFLTLYMFGVSITYAAGACSIFFITSYLRSYVIRRLFRRLEQ